MTAAEYKRITEKMEANGLIIRIGNRWIITEAGKAYLQRVTIKTQ
jgi:hypothetical protein